METRAIIYIYKYIYIIPAKVPDQVPQQDRKTKTIHLMLGQNLEENEIQIDNLIFIWSKLEGK